MTDPAGATSASDIVVSGVHFPLPIAVGALELANGARLDQLVEMGMASRAARAIVKRRPYGSLADVARARGVGPATIGQLREIVERDASAFDAELVLRLWSLAYHAMHEAHRVESLDPNRAERRHIVARILYSLQDALAREDTPALDQIHQAAWPITTEPRPAWVDPPTTYADSTRRFLMLVATTLSSARQQLRAGHESSTVRDGAIWTLAHALLFAFRPGPLTLDVNQCFQRLDHALQRDLAAWPIDPAKTARQAMKAAGLQGRHLRALRGRC